MEMTGEYRIPVDRAAVWKALNDPRILTEAIPGCEDLVRNPDGSMSGRFVATSGPGTPAFASTIALASVVEGQSLTITGEGDGGSAGSVKGVADVRLADDSAGTLLTYVLRTQLGGTLAQLGSRQIDATAKTMIEGVLGALAGRLGDLPTIASTPSLATPGGDSAAEEELIDRLEHRVENFAENVAEAAEEVEEEVEVAAGRGFLGGPYMWGLIALLIVIVILAVLH